MNGKLYVDACAVCGEHSHPSYLISEGLNLDKCSNCGLIFTNPRSSEELISQHFQEEYIEDEYRFEYDFISLRQASLQREANRLKRYFPEGARLLDVGTASGVFLSYFKGISGWQIEGVEPSRYAAKRASQRWGLTVHEGFLGEQHFLNESFDVLTSLDTFNFHPDPNKDLLEMARILRPGGLLALDLPGLNFRLVKNTGLISRLLFGVPVRLNASVHLFFYNRDTLSLMLNSHGFELVRSWPEQSPVYGSKLTRCLNYIFYMSTASLYHLTGGNLNLAPKEFFIFRKR